MINYLQNYLTFKPNPEYDSELIPKDCVVKTLTSADLSITIAYKLVDSPIIVVNCHGNASNISNLTGVYDFYNQTGFSYLLFDYPGYGHSTGTPSEQGCYDSLDLVIQFVQTTLNFECTNIVLHGISLGGAVAIEGLTRYPVCCAVIDSTITNNIEMAKHMFPLLPLWRLVSPRFDSLAKVSKITTPILFFHGTEDEVIPYRMSQELFNQKIGEKDLVLIPKIKHVDLLKVSSPEIIQKFIDFISKYVQT